MRRKLLISLCVAFLSAPICTLFAEPNQDQQEELEIARMRARVDAELSQMQEHQRADLAAEEKRIDEDEAAEREEDAWLASPYAGDVYPYYPYSGWGWRPIAKLYGAHNKGRGPKACSTPRGHGSRGQSHRRSR